MKSKLISKKKANIPPSQYLKISAILLFILGISLAPSGFINYIANEEAHSYEARFARILYSTKKNCESQFKVILANINDDPLDDLIKSKLPTVEEIFLSEWANDRFPTIQIAIVGSIIEDTGTEMVGDINLDGKNPKADLNISSYSSPSNISLYQSKSLWDRRNRYSLTYRLPYIWFNALNGNNQSKNLLRTKFDLTEVQLNLILTWMEISIDGWANNIFYIDVFDFINFAFLGLGLILMAIGFIIFRLEQNKITPKKSPKKSFLKKT
ncbi:MAG: hypothetical protein ACFE9R_02810 [Candidatus Hermodarchaeota archaeon]